MLPPRRIIRLPHPTQPAIDALLAAPAFMYHGDKKYVRNISVVFNGLPEIDLAGIGYARPEVKLDQLRRNYLDEAEITRAADLLKAREAKSLTSVGISFRGAPKTRAGSQGWCIESAVIVHTETECHATVFYRMTEVILKFAADLAFLQEVFERVGVIPRTVEFHFSLSWVGMQFLPVLFVSNPPVRLLEDLRASDRTLWTAATWYLSRYLRGQRVNFGPADRQARFLARSLSPERTAELRAYLREHGRQVEPTSSIVKVAPRLI